jgi:glycosyltransferase involved in cell wall biosynthesis
MKISALIPTYNRQRYIFRAIDSVLSQIAPVDEVILVDDGSTDGTAEEIEHRFGSRIRVIRQANAGVSSARRRAVLEARGDWIAFLDSDDVWTPDRNLAMLEAIEKAPADVAWIFGNIQEVTDDGDGITTYEEHGLRVTEPLRVFEDTLSVQHPFQFGLVQGSVIKREALLAVSCFSENLKHSEDLLVGYQIACRYGVAAIPHIVTKLYRTSDLSASSLMFNESLRPDYYRARMKAFSLAIERSGKRHPWAEQYAHVVRGLCKLHVARGRGSRRLALEQFRYGFSAKSLAFASAAMFGQTGLRMWSALGKNSRERVGPDPQSETPFAIGTGADQKGSNS